MYQALLTNRYLGTRLIPLIAVAAVALCVALVIIVVSVMTGFLDMVKASGRTLVGDVIVSYPITGLPHYERLMEGIVALPEAEAATPIVDGLGLLRMPYPTGENKQTEMVQFFGVDPATFGKVTDYDATIHWRTPNPGEEWSELDFRSDLLEALGPEDLAAVAARGSSFTHPAGGDQVIVLGMHVSIGNERQRDGSYRPVLGGQGHWWMPRFEVALTAVPVSRKGGVLEPKTRAFRVVNEFVSGVFLIDDRRVMIPLRHAQEMLGLIEVPIADDEGEETGEIDPKRATQVLVRCADGVTPDELQEKVAEVYEAFRVGLRADETLRPVDRPPPLGPGGVRVQTWRQQQRQFIDPIEKERELMRVLFSIIYLVCAGLVLSIFWSIVQEKTRDIGILRSVGASRIGIGMIFLRYGAIIGVLGSVVGLGLAWLVVRNINGIHRAMGEPVPVVVWVGFLVLAALAAVMVVRASFGDVLLPAVLWGLTAVACLALGLALRVHRGTVIWDPSVYYFSEIPNELDLLTAAITMAGAVVFSILGAFVPATRAADVDPVKALRYE